MLELNAKTTALVVIDLQEGILPFAGGPHTADEVVNRAGKLAAKFRASGQPVFLVRVGWSADYAEALKQPVDAPSPAKVLPENWWQHPAALGATDSDIEIIKRQWGAFYGTDLELQLRRRGIDTIVLCGISTNIGVESTARNAWELGFNLVIAEDACSAASAEQHNNSINHIYPRIARVRILNGCGWGSPALKSMPATLTAWRATPRFTPCRNPRLSCAGVSSPQMTSASVLSFRRPFRIRQHYGIAMI